MIPPTPPSGKKLNTKELSMKSNAANSAGGMKELLLLDPPLMEPEQISWFSLH